MKKGIILLLILVLITAFFGCSKGSNIIGERALKPTEAVDEKDLIPTDEFYGTFKNSDYTMVIEKTDNEEMHVSVKSAPKNNVGYEWDFSAAFSISTYRINYTDAVKTKVTYDKNGKETSRSTEYNNGVGRIQFSDKDNLKWENSMDSLNNNKFTRQ